MRYYHAKAEGSDVVNPGLNIGGEEFLRYAATHRLAEEFAASLKYGEFAVDAFEPDLDSSSFDPFNNDQFDAFHMSGLNYSSAAHWVNDDA